MRNCLVVTGIPETEEESTDKLIQTLASEKLDITIEDEDIDRSHRLGKPKAGKHRPIIIKFTRYNMRLAVLKKRTKLKGTHIGIQEKITQTRQNLLERAQKLAKESPHIKSAWICEGRLMVLVQHEGKRGRKVIINNYEELCIIWREGLRMTTVNPSQEQL
jgi:hypothetical protein